MKKKLVLVGGGGHCKSCIDVIVQSEQFNIVGILDKPEFVGQNILGCNIIGTDEQIGKLAKEGCEFLITVGHIGTSQLRRQLYAKLKAFNAGLATVISPRAYVSKHALVGEGTIVMHDVLINVDARVGDNCIVNTKALIEHDVVVENHCHISTCAVINGGVLVKQGTFFGSNAVSKEYEHTNPDDFIKAGSLFLGERNE